MSITYTPTTNFGSKDSLPSNDPNKVIKGAEFTTEFTAIQSAFGLAAPSSNPTFTGTATFDSVTANAVSLGDVTTSNLTVSGAFTSLGIDDNATSTAITIDSSENVGIGTDSPDGTLHVKDTIAQLYVQSNDGQPSQVVFGDVTDASGGMIEYTSTDAMAFKTNNLNERMRIDASGNVGIGTATPVSTNNYGGLTLNGASGGALSFTDDDVLVGNLLSSGGDMYFGTGGDTVFRNGGYTGSDEAMRIDSTGNVGIGTAAPATLTVHNNISVGDGTGVTQIAMNRNSANYLAATDPAGYLVFRTGGANERMRIDTSGNVGIGTTNPSIYGGLVIAQDANTSSDGFAVVDSTLAQSAKLWCDGTNSYLSSGNTGNDPLILNTGGGNVGIGTSNPRRKLEVADTGAAIISLQSTDSDNCQIFFGDAASETAGKVLYRHDTNSMSFQTNSAERVRIDSSGNLLVGTTSAGALASPNRGLIDINGSSDSALEFKTAGVTHGYLYESGSEFRVANLTAHPITFYTDNNERMRLDASGHLGIKTTPSPWRTTDGVIELGQRSSLAGLSIDTHLSTNSYFSQASGWKNIDTAVATNYYQNEGNHVWRSAASVAADASTPWVEHMRINSSGVLQVGTTSQYSGALRAVFGVQSGGTACEMHNSGGGAWTAIRFHTESTLAGYISVATNTTAYNTSSDARLKENVVDAPAGNIDSIKVRSFDWKADGEHQEYGFIAQELETVAPYAVSKGETDEDMMAVDYSKLVPMLVKEIQDLKAEVEALKNA